MQQGYFSRSWEAFRSTEGWFAKICVLALVAFIPILGPIVVSGYLLGWARDAAWGMDNPLPRKVFGNEDGRLYRRGLFAWIISLVMGLAVFVVVFVCMSLFGLAAGVFSTLFDGAYAAGFLAIPATIGSFGIGAVSLVVSFAAQFFIWIGCMRMSIYDTLSAGFQIGQIWSMIKRDPVGLLKIFLYELVASLLIGVVLAVIWTVLVFVGMIAAMVFVGAADLSGMAAFAGLLDRSAQRCGMGFPIRPASASSVRHARLMWLRKTSSKRPTLCVCSMPQGFRTNATCTTAPLPFRGLRSLVFWGRTRIESSKPW